MERRIVESWENLIPGMPETKSEILVIWMGNRTDMPKVTKIISASGTGCKEIVKRIKS